MRIGIGERRGPGKAGRRALMFSVIGHTLLALALLFEFVTSRARDAREEQYLAVAFAQAAPERRVRRRPPRIFSASPGSSYAASRR